MIEAVRSVEPTQEAHQVKGVPKPPPPPDERKRMVGWYDPGQLMQTAVEVAISTIFGRHSDRRLVEAMSAGDVATFFDYTYEYVDEGDNYRPDRTRPRDSIWIDYAADVGDGWNSTYAIAYHLAEKRREFAYVDPHTGKPACDVTERGAILVLGGDEVYPTPSQIEYRQRLIAPYETALRYTDPPHPHAFVIPGNHDWYDSLVSFGRLFSAPTRRWFAGWRTPQTRSYFALKLPHNWWLLGTDVQLGSDIDGPQKGYFERLVPEMKQEEEKTGEPARVILCHAEPHWIRAAQYGGDDPNYSESNLKVLEQTLGTKVAVFIAGDLHHYRRHEALDHSKQKITAGGGGAFLHPTHVGVKGTNIDSLMESKDLDPTIPAHMDRIFKLRASYPPPEVSRRLCWRNLIFPYLPGSTNRRLGVAIGALYLLLALGVVWDLDEFETRSVSLTMAIGTGLRLILDGGATALLVGVVVGGFWLFTDTHSKPYRITMGGLHGLLHVTAAFLIAVFCVSALAKYAPDWSWSWDFSGATVEFDARILIAMILILLGGYVVGPLILGAYLLLSLNFFGRHSNEAFSSLGIEDWKNWLRLHVDRNGDLTIYPIGIKTVPRTWKPRAGDTGPELEPVERDEANKPALIEPPIVIKRTGDSSTGTRTYSPLPKTVARSDTRPERVRNAV